LEVQGSPITDHRSPITGNEGTLMAAYNRKGIPERIVLHGFLIAFSMVFVFPFFWMVLNSIKVQREMASSKFRLLPTAPNVVAASPYFDAAEFDEVDGLDGVAPAVWAATRPEIDALLAEKIRTWSPTLSGDPTPVAIPPACRADYQRAMARGLIFVLSTRIGDEAREAGPAAMVRDAANLVNEDLMQETLDRVFRRFCLGGVKFRSDYRIEVVESPQAWRVKAGNASLESRIFHAMKYQQAEVDFAASGKAVFALSLPAEVVASADRIYVGFRGDASWARMVFEVTHGGRVYRTADVVTSSDPGWAEVELRWAGEAVDPMARRSFLVLKDIGQDAPSDESEVRLILAKNSLLGAWRDKIMRNYLAVFREVPFARYIMTSFCLCIINIVLTVFSCTITAYAFSRLEWPGRGFFFAVMLATMMIPGQVVMIPGFLINRYLGFYNSLIPLWLHSMFGSAFFIFLLRQFMMTIPKDIEDSAKIDGCGFLGIYWHVVLPLVNPTIATIAIFTFTGTWNNFMGPLIYVNDERLFPLALGLFKFNLVSGANTSLMMAGSFLMTLPIIVLFFYAQKYFIQGIAHTGTKE
jgi:multiple sugar transport system permease protein